MADAQGNGYQGVELPSLFGSPGSALQNAIGIKQRQQERGDNLALRQEENDYRRSQDVLRQQDKDEMDLYRKVQMLREYTDLSKHQTGNAIADDIGNKKVADVVGKWTGMLQNNKALSYADLLSGVNKDVSGLVGSLDAMKNELNESDEAIKIIKQQFPDADVPRLMQEHRADILNRRISNKNEFINPLEVQPSTFAGQLSDPEFLSRYISGNKNLTEAIINPKGADKSSVFIGQPDAAHTKYEANIPFWRKPNFDVNSLQAGFLPKNVKPELQLKAATLPSDALPSSGNNPFNIIDKDVYDRFAQDHKSNLELISATRSRFPNYDNFNPTEKEYAKRNVLYENIKTLDQSQFHPTATTNTPKTTVNVSTGSAGADNIRNVWKGVSDRVSRTPEGKYTPLNELGATAQQEIVKMANNIAGKTDSETPYTQADIALKKDANGNINIVKIQRYEDGKFKAVGEVITPIDFTSINLPAQANTKAKAAVVAQGNKQPTYKYKGKEYTEAQLSDAAKKSGMSLAEYKKAINL